MKWSTENTVLNKAVMEGENHVWFNGNSDPALLNSVSYSIENWGIV